MTSTSATLSGCQSLSVRIYGGRLMPLQILATSVVSFQCLRIKWKNLTQKKAFRAAPETALTCMRSANPKPRPTSIPLYRLHKTLHTRYSAARFDQMACLICRFKAWLRRRENRRIQADVNLVGRLDSSNIRSDAPPPYPGQPPPAYPGPPPASTENNNTLRHRNARRPNYRNVALARSQPTATSLQDDSDSANSAELALMTATMAANTAAILCLI